MIRVAQKKNKYNNLMLGRADATNLPFEDGIFDVACISFGLHDMIPSIRERVMRELKRVAKTRGTAIIVDYAPPSTMIGRLLANMFRFFEPYYSEFIRYNLEGLITKTGIRIEKKFSVFFGLGQILKGKNIAT